MSGGPLSFCFAAQPHPEGTAHPLSQIFHPSLNVVGRVLPAVVVLSIGALIWASIEIQRSPYVTNVNVAREQPVPFSHEHHVKGLGLDCRYCHATVEHSPYAGMPSTQTCMTCHSQIWTNANVLKLVRTSWQNGTPLPWQRVHNLPDFVYFDHSAHIQKGVGCVTCHWQVDEMRLTFQTASLQMEWCLTCHREPQRFLRPRDRVFDLKEIAALEQTRIGPDLSERYHVLPKQQMENCSLCHR